MAGPGNRKEASARGSGGQGEGWPDAKSQGSCVRRFRLYFKSSGEMTEVLSARFGYEMIFIF